MNLYWMVVSLIATGANTVVAVKDNTEVSWLLFTISLALSVFCVVRALI